MCSACQRTARIPPSDQEERRTQRRAGCKGWLQEFAQVDGVQFRSWQQTNFWEFKSETEAWHMVSTHYGLQCRHSRDCERMGPRRQGHAKADDDCNAQCKRARHGPDVTGYSRGHRGERGCKLPPRQARCGKQAGVRKEMAAASCRGGKPQGGHRERGIQGAHLLGPRVIYTRQASNGAWRMRAQ